jgi:hypothetical protein
MSSIRCNKCSNDKNDNNVDIVDKISTDVTNYLKNKNIPYITTTTAPPTTTPPIIINPPMSTAPPGHTNSSNRIRDEGAAVRDSTCCDGAVKMETIHITHQVNGISDLLYLCDTYKLAENVAYNIDMGSLHRIYPYLLELNGMIGMTAIKQTIVDQIMYFIQQLHVVRASPGSADGSAPKLPPICGSRRLTGAKNATSAKNANNTTPTASSKENHDSSNPVFNVGTSSDTGLFSIFEFKIPVFGYGGDDGSDNSTPDDPRGPVGSVGSSSNGSNGSNGNNCINGSSSSSSSSNNLGNLSNLFKFPLFRPPAPPPATKLAGRSSRQTVSGDYMHTVLYGPPGTGKTEVAKILGNIFCNLGVLKSNTFKKVTRSDLVAGYLGQTAIKTREVIESAIGGVLFIDEAYALGNTEKRDSFSKECIDTLCEALSDHKHELMVIIAGYEKELNDCFFSYNEGLSSRFTWRYKIESYDAVELRKIFEKIIKDNKWTFDERDSAKDEWFKTRQPYFKYFGRDIEVFFTKTKIAHGRRAFYLPEKDRRKLTIKDLDAGFELFSNTDEIKSRGHQLTGPAATMYL